MKNGKLLKSQEYNDALFGKSTIDIHAKEREVDKIDKDPYNLKGKLKEFIKNYQSDHV